MVEFIVDWVTLFVVEDWVTVVMLAVDSTTPGAVVALGVPSDTVVALSVDKADVVPFTVPTVVMEEVSAVCGNVVVLALDIIVVVSVWEVMVDAELVVVLTSVIVVLSDSIVLSLVADHQIVNRLRKHRNSVKIHISESLAIAYCTFVMIRAIKSAGVMIKMKEIDFFFVKANHEYMHCD